MKKPLLAVFCACLFAISSYAQTPTAAPSTPASTAGNVWRVTYMRVAPGKGGDFMDFRRMHSKPIMDEQKKQGLIVDYKYFTQPTSNGPDDWDVALVVMYKTYADAIDANPERGAKLNAIAMAHYGTEEARTKAGQLQNELRTTIASKLVREQMLNLMPAK